MIHRFDTVPSTQDIAHRLAADGAGDGTAVIAAAQTGGRGTRGRRWIAEPGGLWASVIVRPSRESVQPLSIRVGLAVASALDQLSGTKPIELKWPNDLLLQGRKLGGILIEARWIGDRLGWVVVGLGVNVTNPIAHPLAAEAIALREVAPGATLAQVESLALEAILEAAAATGPLGPAEIGRFASRDWLKGRPLVGQPGATGDGITPAGELVLRHADGRRTTVASPAALPDLAGPPIPI